MILQYIRGAYILHFPSIAIDTPLNTRFSKTFFFHASMKVNFWEIRRKLGHKPLFMRRIRYQQVIEDPWQAYTIGRKVLLRHSLSVGSVPWEVC